MLSATGSRAIHDMNGVRRPGKGTRLKLVCAAPALCRAELPQKSPATLRWQTVGMRPSGASLPHARVAPKVRDGESDRTLGLDDEEHAEGEPAEDRAANFTGDNWEPMRPVLNSRERRPEFSEEFRSKAGPLALVPGPRVERVELCLRPDRETRHLPAVAETFLYAFDDLFPGTCFVRSPVVFGKAFFQERLLPVLQRHLTCSRGDAIPKRLHVLDLILDRQRVEPGRRKRQGVSHGWNIPPRYGSRGSTRRRVFCQPGEP